MISRLALICLLLLFGCSKTNLVQTKIKMSRMHIPDMEEIYQNNKANLDHGNLIVQTNAIWSKGYLGRNFYNVPSLYKVGDIIRVKIKVDTKAELSTNIRKNKLSKSQVNTTFSRILDLLMSMVGPQSSSIFQKENSLSNEYNNADNMKKMENISSEISTMVRCVLPNGNLVIGGSQEIRINSDKRIICMAGVIRKEDIENDNSIDSSKIAEARMEYLGEGSLSNSFYKTYIDQVILHTFGLIK
jgi:flagellar L-ring protein precursor FlgH